MARIKGNNAAPPRQHDKKSPLMSIMIGAVILLAAGLGWTFMAKNSQAEDITVFKSPSCGCCGHWVSHLQENGFKVDVKNIDDMNQIKHQLGVPSNLASCHTGKIGDYIVEGHVPAADLHRLLKEKPRVKGIAVPGMPMGSPGMEVPGEKSDHYDVVTFTEDGKTNLFASH